MGLTLLRGPDANPLATGKPTGYWPTDGGQPIGMAVDATGAVYVIAETGLLTKYGAPPA
jgi:hypothetical protein